MIDSLERIQKTRDLVGAFGAVLDEFHACRGGLRIASDELRFGTMLALTEDDEARGALAGWIERSLERQHPDLVAPLLSLLWTAEGIPAGALHAFEARLELDAEPGTTALHEALLVAFRRYNRSLRVAGASGGDVATAELLAAAAADRGLFGVEPDLQDALERWLGEIESAALERYRDGRLDEDPPAVRQLAARWLPSAVIAFTEVVALPGLQIRQSVLEPWFAGRPLVALQLAEGLARGDSIRERFGPALVAAWDSAAHTFGDESHGSDERVHSPYDDPSMRPVADDEMYLAGEALLAVGTAAWFDGLFDRGAQPPMLSGPVLGLLADPSDGRAAGAGDAIGAPDARALLERLASNLGEPRAELIETFRAKATALEESAGSESRATIEYVLRVLEGITAVAVEAGRFAEHLEPSMADRTGEVVLAVRLAAIAAWLDSVALWSISGAVGTGAGHSTDPSAADGLPDGRREPRALLDEVADSIPEDYSVHEYRERIEQLIEQWDAVAVLDDAGPLDLSDDWTDFADGEGFLLR